MLCPIRALFAGPFRTSLISMQTRGILELDKERLEDQALLNGGLSILGSQLEARKRIREHWKQVAGRLLDAHLYAVSVTASLVSKRAGEPRDTTDSLNGRLSLTASFVQGIDICEVAISEGLYVQASNLLKQEMETVAATVEFREGRRNDRKTPNVKNLAWGLSMLYGELNSAAHVADETMLFEIVSSRRSAEIIGASTHPEYNEEFARQLYGLHVCLILLNAMEIDFVLQEMYGDEISEAEARMLFTAFHVLQEVGWLVSPASG